MKSRFPYETRSEMRIMGRIGQKQRMERVLALDISGKHLHNKIVASTAANKSERECGRCFIR